MTAKLKKADYVAKAISLLLTDTFSKRELTRMKLPLLKAEIAKRETGSSVENVTETIVENITESVTETISWESLASNSNPVETAAMDFDSDPTVAPAALTASDLTDKEQLAIVALGDCANGAAGGDFGFFDEINIPAGIKGEKGMSALVGSLIAKDLIGSDEPVVNGKKLGTSQFDLSDTAWDIFTALGAGEQGQSTYKAAITHSVIEIEAPVGQTDIYKKVIAALIAHITPDIRTALTAAMTTGRDSAEVLFADIGSKLETAAADLSELKDGDELPKQYAKKRTGKKLLTAENEQEIADLRVSDPSAWTYKALAEQFGCSQLLINKTLRRFGLTGAGNPARAQKTA